MICTVENTVTLRRCTCQVCGEPLNQGEKRITYSTPTQKTRHAHTNCYYRMSEEGYGLSHTMDDNHPTKDIIPHTVTVIANREDCGYFGQYKFKVAKHNAQFRKFESVEPFKNRHSSGHIVPIALAEGYRVFINGTEIKSFEEFEKLTKR